MRIQNIFNRGWGKIIAVQFVCISSQASGPEAEHSFLGAKIVSGWKIDPVRPLRKTRLKKVRFTAPLVKARTEKQFSGVRRRRAVTVLQPPRRRGDEPVRFAVLI